MYIDTQDPREKCTEKWCAVQTDHRKRYLGKRLYIFEQVLDQQFQALLQLKRFCWNSLSLSRSTISPLRLEIGPSRLTWEKSWTNSFESFKWLFQYDHVYSCMMTFCRRNSNTNFMNINPHLQHPSKLMKRQEMRGLIFSSNGVCSKWSSAWLSSFSRQL